MNTKVGYRSPDRRSTGMMNTKVGYRSLRGHQSPDSGNCFVLPNGRRVYQVDGGFVAADDSGWLEGVRPSVEAWMHD